MIKYSKLESRLLKIAKELADEMPHYHVQKCKHFSFIVHGNRILSVGQNMNRKTNPLAMRLGHRFNASHSEMSAYLSCRWMNLNWKSIDFFNIRLGNQNYAPMMSCPCNSCKILLKDIVKVKQCHFTNVNGEFETIKF